MESIWDEVDQYFSHRLAPDDDVLHAAAAASTAAGLPTISVTPTQGKFLQLLARLCGARRILEIGTLGGYSTIWLARALPPDGRLITLEIDARHAAVARRNVERAALAERVEIRVGPARDSLAAMVSHREPPFDLVFIDADKASGDVYVTAALALSRIGTIIVVDNVVRRGEVIDGGSTDENVLGIRRVIALLSSEPRLSATALQTVGSKGHDGFAIALVTG